MPDDTPTPEPNTPPEPATDPAPEPTPDPDYPDGLGDAGKKALDAERKARRDAEAKIKELEPQAAKARELEDAGKTEQQRLTDQRDAEKQRADKAEADAARYRAAMEHGLSAEDLDLLDGVPADKIEERAKLLAERLAHVESKPKPAPSSRRQGGGNDKPKASVATGRELYEQRHPPKG
jgi:hypothetical protein